MKITKTKQKIIDVYRNLRFGWSDSGIIKSKKQKQNKKYKIYCQMGDVTPETGENIHENTAMIEGNSQLGNSVSNYTDTVASVVTVSDLLTIDRAFLKSAQDETPQSIKYYLGKPHAITTGTLATTDAASTFPLARCFAPVWNNPVFNDKLKGVFSWKATTVVTLQVNATKFQAGRYILAYLPTGGGTTGQLNTNWFTMKRATKMQVTQLPHVELNISTQSEVTLKIPYCSWMNSTPTPNVTYTSSTIGDPGFFFIYPYSPLIAGSGSTVADYVIYVHYEDIELFSNTTAQMGDINVEEQKHDGPMSGGIKVVQRYLGFASVKLNNIVTAVDWVLDAAAGAASSLGWSKPVNISDVDSRMLQIHPGFANSDGKDPAKMLSLSQKNYVDIAAGFACSANDEMTIDYIKSIPSYYDNVTWTTTDTVGTNIWNELIYPDVFKVTNLDGATPFVSMTPVCYLSNLFDYYRGSFKLIFKLVKTEFHTGRLLISVMPIDRNKAWSSASPSLVQTSYLQRTIIDVKNCSEFEIMVPWYSNTPWKANAPSNALLFAGNSGEAYAMVSVMVLSPLIAPSSVGNTIPIMIEVVGGKDLEYSVPKTNYLSPYCPTSIQCGKVYCQSGKMTTGVVPCSMGDCIEKNLSIHDAACCMGEVVTSLRQLLKKPGFFANNTTATNDYIWARPYFSQVTVGNIVTPTTFGTVDMYTHLTAIFALKRGSVRVKILPDVPYADSTCFTTLTQAYYNQTFTKPYGSGSTVIGGIDDPRVLANGANTNVDKVEWGISTHIPYYNTTVAQPSLNHLLDGSTNVVASQYGTSATTLNTTYRGTNAVNAQTTLFRSGGDDCNFGMWTGIPPFFIQTTFPN